MLEGYYLQGVGVLSGGCVEAVWRVWRCFLGCVGRLLLLFYLDITYINLILIYNVDQTMDDENNNILYTTRHTEHT